MTICYWGGFRGGKKSILYLMRYNQKKYCVITDHTMTLFDDKVNWMGYSNKRDKKRRVPITWDFTSKITRFYHIEGSNEMYSTTKTQNKVTNELGTLAGFIGKSAILNFRLGYSIKFDDDTVMQYVNPKNEGTSLHWKALGYITNGGKWTTTDELPRIKVEDIPDCHLVLPYKRQANWAYEGVQLDDSWNKFRNIVPYKSNLLDMTVAALNNWRENFRYERDNPFLTFYKEDKQKLWHYLYDLVFRFQLDVPKKLNESGITFEYFDLDKGDHKEVFGVEKEFSGFRNIFHHHINVIKWAIDKKRARKDYFMLRDIAKEFLEFMGNPKDNREYLPSPNNWKKPLLVKMDPIYEKPKGVF
tara:strand:- start:442 stop:1515 length:1074 start_codon:yes stop_codon:yes gene_type:complete